jgi:hypothetical protein
MMVSPESVGKRRARRWASCSMIVCSVNSITPKDFHPGDHRSTGPPAGDQSTTAAHRVAHSRTSRHDRRSWGGGTGSVVRDTLRNPATADRSALASASDVLDAVKTGEDPHPRRPGAQCRLRGDGCSRLRLPDDLAGLGVAQQAVDVDCRIATGKQAIQSGWSRCERLGPAPVDDAVIADDDEHDSRCGKYAFCCVAGCPRWARFATLRRSEHGSSHT